MSDAVLILTACLSLLIILLIGLIVWKGRSGSNSDEEEDEDEKIGSGTRTKSAPVAVERDGPRRQVKKSSGKKAAKDSDEEDPLAAIEEELGVTLDGKVGKKKMRKLEAKIERRHARDREAEEREERKQRQELLEQRRKQEDEKREAEEKAEAERQRLEQEEKERKEHEEYLLLKSSFEIQEEGFDEVDEDQGAANKLQQFIQYIENEKVVLLEDLAAHFQMRTQDAISRLQDLLNQETLVGVIDDRGKFIHITRDELQSVAKFIRQRGRVSLTELVDSSNSLINLTPVNSSSNNDSTN
jgi:actin-related protein